VNTAIIAFSRLAKNSLFSHHPQPNKAVNVNQVGNRVVCVAFLSLWMGKFDFKAVTAGQCVEHKKEEQ